MISFKAFLKEQELVKHIEDNHGEFADWYCGVTDSVSTRLAQHESKGATIKLPASVECSSMNTAVDIESRMHTKGCKGGGGIGGVTSDSKHVYVFKRK